MKSGSNLEKVLAAGQFAVTAELGPPKSADVEIIRKKAGMLQGVVDAVNITDNQTAIVRMSSIAAGAIVLKECGLEPIVQMTCRDRNRIMMQSDILGAYALGLRNLLCLSGDHQKFGNHPTAKNVYDLDSIQLIGMVRDMRDKKVFQCGDEIKNSKTAPVVEPRLFIGAAANPFADPFEFRVTRLAKKIAAGADFIQTQTIFDVPRFTRWMQLVRDRGLDQKVKILAGVMPVKSHMALQYMKNEVAGMSIPDEWINRLKSIEDKDRRRAEGVAMCVETIQQVRQIPGVAGVHIMAVEWEEIVKEVVEKAKLR